jgi:general secretion pathway protein K
MMSEHRSDDMPANGRNRWRRGLALLAVLWTLTLLAVIAASFTTETRADLQLARNIADNAQAEAHADAGIYRGIIAAMDRNPFTAWIPDGRAYEYAFDDGVVRIALQDETGKIDLNTTPEEVLHNLFVLKGLDEDAAEALVDAILDFRDPDNLRHLQGAEDEDYAAAGLPHDAKDAPFQVIDELMQVIGMSRSLYQRVAPFITVDNPQGGINPVVAPRDVLLALPQATERDVDAFLDDREAAADDALLRQSLTLPIPAAEQMLIPNTQGFVFTIAAEGRTPDGASFVRRALVDLTARSSKGFAIRTWQRGRLSDLPPRPADPPAGG